MHKSLGYVLTTGAILSLFAGSVWNSTTAHASTNQTRVSSARSASTGLSFSKAISSQTNVDDDQAINKVFPDSALASAVADTLGVSTDANFKDSLQTAITDHNSLILTINTPITDWTGIRLLKNHINGGLKIDNQDGDFGESVLHGGSVMLAMIELLPQNDSNLPKTLKYLSFQNDGVGNDTFKSIIARYKKVDELTSTELHLDGNNITDLTPLNDLKGTDSKTDVYGTQIQNQTGTSKSSTAVTESDGSIKISNADLDKLAQTNMPKPIFSSLSYNPTQFTRALMFDTTNNRQVYDQQTQWGNLMALTSFGTESGIKPMPDSPTKQQVIDYLQSAQTFNVSQHIWHDANNSINPTVDENLQPITTGTTELLAQIKSQYGYDLTPEEAGLTSMTVTGVSKDASSITLRTDYTNSYSGAGAGMGTTIDIPVNHASSSSDSSSSSSSSSNSSSGNSWSSSSSNSSTSSSSSSSSTPTPIPTPVVKGQAVYGVKTIYLYHTKTFSKTQRIAKYTKQARVNRPQFVVTGFAHSQSGRLRYKVRDVNHKSKTNGKVGYITTEEAYVKPTYIQTVPKSERVRVIAKHGVNAYRHINLSGKVKHYRMGQTLKVKSVKSYHLATRYVLANGRYISANKTLIK